jgi:ferredoxin-NADP reductase/sterol desaturase/sphingolipid hydroxylase (fatty acid hydroxylase superfamily)
MNFQKLIQQFLEAFAENSITYALFAIPFFVAFWIIWKKKFQTIRIQEVKRATDHHFKHDLAYSASTFTVFAIMDIIFLYLESKGYTLIYFDVNKYGWGWIIISFCLLLFLNDTFFYWSHRAMHHPKLYKFFHRVHHESTDPSPLTAFAFHPSEAIVENMMAFILPFIIPLHFGVILAWQMFDMLNNVLGHLGYEAYPKGWVKLPILKYKTASTHHNMHHQLFNGNYALYFTWWDKWMGTEFKDYETHHEQIFERRQIKKSADGLYVLTVTAVRREANDAFTIEFGNVPSVFRDFSAGQHVIIKVNIHGETLYRTFSLSSIPNTNNTATLTIKKIKGGKVTNYLAQHLKIGDTLEVTAPSGQFFLRPEPANEKQYVLIAGGSGITPIYSMAGSILNFEPKSKITLLYANRNMQSIIFKERLEEWKKQYPSQLEIKHFLSEEEHPQQAIKGFITRISLEEIINQKDKSKLDFYLCGPEMMTNKLIEDLHYLGIAKEKIHRELFLIAAQTASGSLQKAAIHATVYGKQYRFETKEGETILQSGLQHNIPLAFSCQSGLCGTCKMKCTEGKVQMKNNQVLSDADIKAGYILTCQSLPQTQTINIQNS